MSGGRPPNPRYEVSANLVVRFIGTPEPADDFQKRREEVQNMMVRILLNGKKQGRPRHKEEADEIAA